MPYDKSMNKITINRELFLDGKDPLIATIRDKYPGIYDIDNLPTVKDPIRKLESGKVAKAVLNEWLKTTPGSSSNNKKPKPYVYPTLSKFAHSPDHDFGECLLLSVAKGSTGFKCRFLNTKGSDSYIHHVSMAAVMQQGVMYRYSDINKISASKSGNDAYTISHLCGNGSCCRPVHLLIEKKTVNDERVHCHFVLRNCTTKDESNIVMSICPHNPKCFTNVYNTNKPYY